MTNTFIPKLELTHAVILGGLGQVGRLLSQSLQRSGISVTVVDSRALDPVADTFSGVFLSTDVNSVDNELTSIIAACQCVCVCLPEQVTLDVADALLDTMPKGSLWVDTLSVKDGIARRLTQHADRLEILSVNPMFAPALGWAGNVVAAAELSVGPKSTYFRQLLSEWGAAVELVTAAEHDELTAGIQVATHASILAFGDCLASLNLDLSKAIRLATPPHRLLLTLLHRIASQNPEVYWDIQTYHPLAPAVRQKLADAIGHIDIGATEDGREQFDLLFRRIQNLLDPEAKTLQTWSQRVFSPSAE